MALSHHCNGMWDNMEITLASSPEVNTYMSDRIKVAEYQAIYINFRKIVKAKKQGLNISRLTGIILYLHHNALKNSGLYFCIT